MSDSRYVTKNLLNMRYAEYITSSGFLQLHDTINHIEEGAWLLKKPDFINYLRSLLVVINF
jgi:hypothetical protein